MAAKNKKKEEKKKKKSGSGLLILVLIGLFGWYLVSQSPSSPESGDKNLSIPTATAKADIDVGKEVVVAGDYEPPELPPACQGDDVQFVGEIYTDEAGVRKYRLDPAWFPGEGLSSTWFAGTDKTATAKYCTRHPRLYWGYFLRNTTLEKLEGFNIEDESSWTVRADDTQLLQYTKLWGTKFRLSIKSEFKSKYMLTYNKLWYKFMIEKLRFFITDPYSEENFVVKFPSDGDGLSYDNVDADRLKKEEKSPYDGGGWSPGGSSDSPSPTPTVIPLGDPVRDQYAVIAGEDVAEAAFVNNYDSQCYATIIAVWEDFETNTELNAIVRSLGPTGFYFSNSTGSDSTGFVARSNQKNDGGLSACVVVNGFTDINYLEGTWQNSEWLGQMMFHWSESYPNDATEIQLANGSWIHPVFGADQPVEDYIYDVEEEIINLYDLDDYFTSENLSEVSTTDCPAEPLTGTVSITEADIIVSFDGATTAALRYSKTACEENGGLTFSGYDPGRGDDEQVPIWGEPNIYVWPLTQNKFTLDDQPKTPFPTDTGFEKWPAEGSLVTPEQLVALMKATESDSGLARCSNITDGEVPGLPNAILIDFGIGAFTVDPGGIPGILDQDYLCHYTLPADTDYVRVGISVYTRQPSPTEIEMQGPFVQWNGAWWGPYE